MTKKKGLGQLPEDNTVHPDTYKSQEDGPKITPNVQEEENKKIVDAFIKNPEMKKQAGILAFEIQKEFSNWFSIPQLIKKFKTNTVEAAKKIEMLMLFNYCIGKVEKGKPFFKIDIDHRAQRSLIMNEIAEYEGKILFLKEKLGKLD